MTWRVIEADCVEAMREMEEASVDAVVTDPPYGLEFMGKEWDAIGTGRKGNPFDPTKRHMTEAKEPKKGNPWASERESYGAPKKMPKCGKCGKWRYNGNPSSQCSCEEPEWVHDTSSYPRAMQAWHEAWATEALRVLKPGGHLLAFGGTRTYHRLACAVEDAGFEIRDSVIWLYGSGFPKSLDVSKAIDKAAGAEREVVGTKLGQPGYSLAEDQGPGGVAMEGNLDGSLRDAEAECAVTAPATPEAQRWQGFGTALKPSHEPVVVARKPLIGTVAQNCLEFGTGALNIDGTRIGVSDEDDIHAKNPHTEGGFGHATAGIYGDSDGAPAYDPGVGRWPANIVLDEAAAAELDRQSGERPSAGRYLNPEVRNPRTTEDEREGWIYQGGLPIVGNRYANETGGASRFFATFHQGEDDVLPSLQLTPSDRRTAQGTEEHAQAEAMPEVRSPDSGGGHQPDRDDKPLCGSSVPEGQPARFRYVAKASRAERNAGLEGFEERFVCLDCGWKGVNPGGPGPNGVLYCLNCGGYEVLRERGERFRERASGTMEDDSYDWTRERERGRQPRNTTSRNHHPTVKPVDLMRWLCRLVVPPGGVCLDPFAGSGTTGIACVLEDFDFIGIEREAEYVEIARARIDYWARQPKQLDLLDAA